MGEDGRGAGHRDAGDVGRSCRYLSTGRGTIVALSAKIVGWLGVIVDGESWREWSERGVVEVGV